jgi:hypothetical protein
VESVRGTAVESSVITHEVSIRHLELDEHEAKCVTA